MIECGERKRDCDDFDVGQIFSMGISQGGDVITVQDEIDHLNSYLTIQKMRYKDKLDFLVDVNPDIGTYRLPKLLIQPWSKTRYITG